MKGLAGKRVVVTGGTSGIGAATAQRFRDEGGEVIVLARAPGTRRHRLRRERPRPGASRPSRSSATSTCSINNAGVSARNPALDITPEQWDEVRRHQPEWRLLGGAGGRPADARGAAA